MIALFRIAGLPASPFIEPKDIFGSHSTLAAIGVVWKALRQCKTKLLSRQTGSGADVLNYQLNTDRIPHIRNKKINRSALSAS
jgi:hypothetical protein